MKGISCVTKKLQPVFVANCDKLWKKICENHDKCFSRAKQEGKSSHQIPKRSWESFLEKILVIIVGYNKKDKAWFFVYVHQKSGTISDYWQ